MQQAIEQLNRDMPKEDPAVFLKEKDWDRHDDLLYKKINNDDRLDNNEQ